MKAISRCADTPLRKPVNSLQNNYFQGVSRLRLSSEGSEESEDDILSSNYESGESLLERTFTVSSEYEDDRNKKKLVWADNDNPSQNLSIISTIESISPRESKSKVTREFETVSNDGSEVSAVSLGTKIQMIAKLQRKNSESCHQQNYTQDDTRNRPVGKFENIERWRNECCTPKDSEFEFQNNEWRELLQKNNELLAKLSNEDNPLHIQYNNYTNINVSTSKGAEYNTALKFGERFTNGLLSEANTNVISKYNKNYESDKEYDSQLKAEAKRYLNTISKPINSVTPTISDCMLEDINEENSEEDTGVLMTKRATTDSSDCEVIEPTSCNADTSIASHSTDSEHTSSRRSSNYASGGRSTAWQNSLANETSLLNNETTDSGISISTYQDNVDKIISLPSRSEFITQKNNIAKSIMKNIQKKKELQKEIANATSPPTETNEISDSAHNICTIDREIQVMTAVADDTQTQAVGITEVKEEAGVTPRDTNYDVTIGDLADNLIRLLEQMTARFKLEGEIESTSPPLSFVVHAL